jgi:hypothetical protein
VLRQSGDQCRRRLNRSLSMSGRECPADLPLYHDSVQQACQDVALYLSDGISKLGPFELITDGSDIPVFCWALKEPSNYSLYDMAER